MLDGLLPRLQSGFQGLIAKARPHVLPTLAVTAVLALIYRPTLGWLANAWMNDDYYGHGLLMPPVVLFFMWRARERFAAATVRATQPVDYAGVALAAVVFAVGWIYHEPFLLASSLVLAIGGVLMLYLGLPRARPLLPALLFLFLAVPIPNLLYVGVEMQKLATWGTTNFLSWWGVPMQQDNFTITAGSLRFEVVPLCSGLSSSVSVLTLATIVAALSPLPMWGRALIVAASVPAALIANVLRISLTIWIGMTWGPEASQGFLHGASSMVLFLLALGVVLAFHALLVAITRRGEPSA